jgi:RNA polymerase sigma factor for flagellar operon FliA
MREQLHDNSGEARALVEGHLAIPTRVARKLYARVRRYVEFDELVSLGNAGLVEAARRFDPARKVTFAVFAWYRVHGAIVDGLRRQSNLPRRTWRKLVALRTASDQLEQRAEAGSNDNEPRAREELADMLQAASAIRAVNVSLEAIPDAVNVASENDPREMIGLGAGLFEAIAALPANEQLVVTKHYFGGVALAEIAGELGVSRSWASLVHVRAIHQLRRWFETSVVGPKSNDGTSKRGRHGRDGSVSRVARVGV